MTASYGLTFIPFVLASLLLIATGGLLLVAPGRFIAIGHWWGRKIGLPNSNYRWNVNSLTAWRNWRLPGLYLLCFGLFILIVLVRSFLRIHS